MFACNSSQTTQSKGKTLAQVGQTMLYENDLAGLIIVGTSKTDSAEIANRYINAWVRKQLILAKAQKEVKIDEAAIQRKLADYRYDLIAYEFEKAYIEKNLNKTVSEAEIAKYYQENPANFELKQNIVKAHLVKLPANLVEKDSVKFLLQTANSTNLAKLKEYCVKFAESYTLNDSTWVDFEEIIKNSPFKQIANKVDFLKQNTFAETGESNFVYYLRLLDYKITNQTSPLPFVRQRIVNMIINQRKVNLAKTLEKNIFEEAKKNKSFLIHK